MGIVHVITIRDVQTSARVFTKTSRVTGEGWFFQGPHLEKEIPSPFRCIYLEAKSCLLLLFVHVCAFAFFFWGCVWVCVCVGVCGSQ